MEFSDYINVDGSHLMNDSNGWGAATEIPSSGGGFDFGSLFGGSGGGGGGFNMQGMGKIAGLLQGLLSSGSQGNLAGSPAGGNSAVNLNPTQPIDRGSYNIQSSIPVPFDRANFAPYVPKGGY